MKSISFLLLLTAFASAQQGDKRDKKGSVQRDPIPAEKIPPSPLLNLKEAMQSIKMAKGFVLEPIAVGDLVHMPVAMTFDADGRAWVVEMTQYMEDLDGKNENKPTGRIRVLEDTNDDGKFDKVTTFLDRLVIPRAAAVTSDGLLFTSGDALYFTKRDGLKPTGKPELIDKTYAVGGNPEHKANGLLLGRDNWYYNAKSDRRYRRINGKWVKDSTSFRGQWGIAQDDAGRLFHNNNSTLLIGDQFRPNFFRQHPGFKQKTKHSHKISNNRVYPSRITPGLNRAYLSKTLGSNGKLVNATAAAGMVIYRGDNFPQSYYGSAFTTEPGGNLVKLINIKRDSSNKPIGSHPIKQDEFITSTDEWFRPVNLYTGPDGTMWMVDMYFGLIQHKAYMTTYLRKQYSSRNLDKPMTNNGRIYRIRYQANPASKPLKLSQMTTRELIPLLGHPNGFVRDTSQRLLVERLTDPTNKNIDDDLTDWNKYIRKAVADNGAPVLKLYGLWVYESIGDISNIFLQECLKSKDVDVVNSALELVHMSDNSEAAAVMAMQPTSQTLHSYIFALGKIGTTESHQRAVSLIEKNSKTGYLKEAYVSGLGTNAAKVVKSVSIKDKKFAKLLSDAAKKQPGPAKPVGPRLTAAEQKIHDHGKSLYLGAAACSGCHGNDGAGTDLAPPLVPSNWITEDKERLLKVILHGLKGPISVNGKRYNLPSVMPGRLDLKDGDIANLLTYLRNSNAKSKKPTPITPSDVKRVRELTKERNAVPYTEEELKKGKNALKLEEKKKSTSLKPEKMNLPDDKPNRRSSVFVASFGGVLGLSFLFVLGKRRTKA